MQVPVDAESVYQVTRSLRAGIIDGIGRPFDKIILIGHSFGSITAQTLSARHGDAVDALVLTGYTKRYKPDAPGVLLDGLTFPAALFDERFKSLPVGYVVLASKTGREYVLYSTPGEEFDPDLYDFDFERQDVLALGDGLSALFAVDLAPDFKGPVQVVNGQADNVFCSLAIPIVTHADCGEGPTSYTAQVGTLYPSASNFSYTNIQNTGHDLIFHYSFNETLGTVHDFLTEQGF